MWKLVIENEGDRTQVPLRGGAYGIGRAPGNQIRLTEKNVSRQHARIWQTGRRLVLEDLGSENGTFLNAERVNGAADLENGDLIHIGDYVVIVENEATPPPPTRQPPLGPARNVFQPARLVMLSGPTPGSEHALTKPRMDIGRGDGVAIVVEHNSVSRRHCEIQALGDGRFEVVDLESANGIEWNRQRLGRAIMNDGDELALGEVRFRFVGEGRAFRPQKTEVPVPARGAAAALSHVLPYLVFVVVVAVGGVTAWLFVRG